MNRKAHVTLSRTTAQLNKLRAPSAATRLLCAALALALFPVSAVNMTASPLRQRTPLSGAQTTAQAARASYQINLALNFDARTYTGTERVRWINRDDRPTSVLYFHLYPNLRSDIQRESRPPMIGSGTAQGGAATPDEPRLEVSEVRAAATGAPLAFGLDDQGVTLRVNLREPVAAGAATEVLINFGGSVPEIDAEETGLVVHVLQQVGAALRSGCGTRWSPRSRAPSRESRRCPNVRSGS